MLSGTALAFAAVLAGAAAAELPVTGAFGLEFDEPVPRERLGASLGKAPYPLPPDNIEQRVPPDEPDGANGWFLFVPAARPELLEAPEVRFYVLRSHTGFPVRILAEHPNPSCVEDVLWLTRSLARKYQAEDDPFGTARAGFRQSARFVSPEGQVDVSCGPALLIEYTDPRGYRTWLAQRDARIADAEARRAALEAERERLEGLRRREFADLFTAGDRHRLEGVFGITFGEPVAGDWLETAEVAVDEALATVPPRVPDSLLDGSYTVTVGPDRKPVRVTGEFPDADASRFEFLAGALEEKFGPPLKDTPQHRIHKVNGDYLVARYLPDAARARLVFIDDVAREAQRQREAAAQAARLAEQRRQFEEETAGL